MVENVNATGVEARLSSDRLEMKPWKKVRKSVHVGDHVLVNAGSLAGKSGWIVSVAGDYATIVTGDRKGEVKTNEDIIEVWNSTYRFNARSAKHFEYQYFEAYINYLISGSFQTRVVVEDSNLDEHSHRDSVKRNNHPWIGIEVVVTNQQATKGWAGVVEDVIQSNTTNGPPRIVMRTTTYDPNIPYTTITIGSDAVVTKKFVYMLAYSKGEINKMTDEHNRRHHSLCSVNKTNSADYRFDEILPDNQPARGQTPEPVDGGSSSTPAWNASSSDFISSFTVPQKLAHPFMHPSLRGATVKTYVKDNATEESSRDKETSVFIDQSNGSCALRTKKYHQWHPLSVDSVTPKHPSPTHDNGLIIVIQGEHTGAYGRRLGHVKRNGITYMVLEIVTIKEGKADTLTGKIIELPAEDMCVVDESASQKKLNTDLMKISRRNYQKEMKNRF